MNNVTVLYPGSFKPLHAGHIDLINKYAADSSVNKIKIFVSPSKRGDVSQALAHEIISKIIDNPKVSIEEVKEASPVTTVYNFLEIASPGKYALASSTKEDDYKRVTKFINYFKNKKLPKGVKVVELLIDASALNYSGRSDEHEGKPISASILRTDIENDDFISFQTNYPNSNLETIKNVWNLLKLEGQNRSK